MIYGWIFIFALAFGHPGQHEHYKPVPCGGHLCLPSHEHDLRKKLN